MALKTDIIELDSGIGMQLTASELMHAGDVVYINASGEAVLCNATSVTTCPFALAICNDVEVLQGAVGTFLTHGKITNIAWDWGDGLLYVSSTGTTGNTLTQTPPANEDNVDIPVAIALSATEILFTSNFSIIIHA